MWVKWMLRIVGVVIGGVAIVFVAVLAYLWWQQRKYEAIEDTHDLGARIDRLAKSYVDKRPAVRLVIGVWQRGQSRIEGYGAGRPADKDTTAAKTIFEIGSVTKTFSGILLAKLAGEASAGGATKVRLDDPITKYLPAEVALPEPARSITLVQLATHTSGLPRLPENLDAVAKDMANPYAEYKAADLYACLREVKLDRPPGEAESYSNLGMGLLGHLLSLAAKQPYEMLVRNDICEPLGMKDTTIALFDEQRTRLVAGHSPDGKEVPNWDMDVLAPAGALRSTADDMLKYIRANLDPSGGPLAQPLSEAQKKHFEHWSGRHQGLGWQIVEDATMKLTIIWHNGGTGGYVSFVGFVPGHDLGVVLLSNYGDAMAGDDSLDQMALEILRLGTKVSLNQPSPPQDQPAPPTGPME